MFCSLTNIGLIIGINRLLKFADIPSASEPFFEALAALET
jgi:hypothetical protein